uniref:Chromo domain-containing protein n=1 Tax=Syphacia muris TaxID=451379 RepID=A0A0N5B064_9BILA
MDVDEINDWLRSDARNDLTGRKRKKLRHSLHFVFQDLCPNAIHNVCIIESRVVETGTLDSILVDDSSGKWHVMRQTGQIEHWRLRANFGAMKYCRGQIVVCKWKGTSTQYEAKIIDVSSKRKKTPYKVHYLGWKNKWDEWIGEERIMKIKTCRSRVVKNFEADTPGSADCNSITAPSTSKQHAEDHLKHMAVAGAEKPGKSGICLIGEQKQGTSFVEPSLETATINNSAIVATHNQVATKKNDASAKQTAARSTKRNDSRKRKMPTGWIRRSSRTQKLQMQQLGISEELVDKLMKDVDSSPVVENHAEPGSSGEMLISKGKEESKNMKVPRSTATNASVCHKRNHVKSKKMKLILSSEASSEAEINVKNSNQTSTTFKDGPICSNGNSSAVKQEQNSEVKVEDSCTGCRPGSSISGGDQCLKNVKTEETSSDSHSADMISPTTAMVNIAYELIESFPSLSDGLSSKFLSLSPALVILNLINELKSCEKYTLKNVKDPLPSTAVLQKNVDSYNESRDRKFSEGFNHNFSRRKCFDNNTDSCCNSSVLRSSDNNSPQLVNDQQIPSNAEFLTPTVSTSKETISGGSRQFQDVELTDGVYRVLNLLIYKVVPQSLLAILLHPRGTEIRNYFPYPSLQARKKMGYQRPKELMPLKTTQRLGFADIFRRNQRKLNSECSNFPDVPSTSKQHLCNDSSVLRIESINFQKSCTTTKDDCGITRPPFCGVATKDDCGITRPPFCGATYLAENKTNQSINNSVLVGCCAYNSKSDGCNHKINGIQQNNDVALPEGDLCIQAKIKKQPTFEDFIPLPPHILEDHCYIKMPNSLYSNDNKRECMYDSQVNDDESVENDMAIKPEVVNGHSKTLQEVMLEI